jgi:hypothetical protein
MEILEPQNSRVKNVPRYLTNLSVRYKLENAENWQNATVREISLKGVKIVIPKSEASGSANSLPPFDGKAHILLQFSVSTASNTDVNLLLKGIPVGEPVSQGSAHELDIEFVSLEEEEQYPLVDLIALLLFEGKAFSASLAEKKAAAQSF